MRYRITRKNIFYAFNEVIIYGIILLSITIYLWHEYPGIFLVVSVLLTFFYLFVIFFPVLILFLNYYRYNKDDTVIIEKTKIIFNNRVINTQDIQKIDIFGNRMYLSGQVGKLPHQDYFYFLLLTLKDGSQLILTSLLERNIDKKIKEKYSNLTYIEHVRSYPLISDIKH